MRGLASGMAAALAAGLLGGCATPIPPVQVTRFHQAAPAPQGSIAIVGISPDASQSIEFRSYAAAVGQELQRLGFSEAPAGAASDYVARVDFQRTVRSSAQAGRSPVSVGVGGSTGSYGSGIGLGVGIDLSGPPRDILVFSLSVQIRRAGGEQAVWEGRAVTEAKDGTPAAQPGLAAAKLASALFRDYPGRSGETIIVK